MIEWECDRVPDTDRRYDGPTDTRYGVVAGDRRFRLVHAGDPSEDWWVVLDLGPDGGESKGSYAACVDWCFQRLKG